MVGAVEFLIIVAVLYLLECIWVVPPSSLVFERCGASYRLRTPYLYPGSGDWGWVLLNPFRPSGPAFCCPRDLVFTPGAPASGKSNSLTPEARLSCLMSRIGAGWDTRLIREQVNRFTTLSRRQRSLSIVCFGILFLLLPAAVWIGGLRWALAPSALVLLLVAILAARTYTATARAIYPAGSRLDRIGQAAKMILYPVSVIRGTDALSRNHLNRFDSTAIAFALCGRKVSLRLATRDLAEATYQWPADAEDQTASVAAQELQQARLRVLTEFSTLRESFPRSCCGRPVRPRLPVAAIAQFAVYSTFSSRDRAPIAGMWSYSPSGRPRELDLPVDRSIMPPSALILILFCFGLGYWLVGALIQRYREGRSPESGSPPAPDNDLDDIRRQFRSMEDYYRALVGVSPADGWAEIQFACQEVFRKNYPGLSTAGDAAAFDVTIRRTKEVIEAYEFLKSRTA